MATTRKTYSTEKPVDAATTTFELRLRFTGICYFLRNQRDTLHVLFPTTGHHHGSSVHHQHYSRVYYDKAYLTGVGPLTGSLASARVEDGFFDFTSVKGGGITWPADTGIVDLFPVTRKKPGKILLTKNPHTVNGDNDNPNDPSRPRKRLASRVDLAAGSPTCVEEGALWKYNGADVRFPNRLMWTIPGIAASSLDLVLYGFDGEPNLPVATLRPVNGVIELSFYNVIKAELPGEAGTVPMPSPGQPSEHFDAFYDFFKAPGGGRELPKYVSDATTTKCPDPNVAVSVVMGVVPAACLTGGDEFP